MSPKEFLEASGRTDLHREQRLEFYKRCGDEETIDLLHAAMGVSTEAGELLDVLKKFLAYGKPMDKVNILEECGDIEWYLAIIYRRFNVTKEEVLEMNINKLKKRFPDKFDADQAINRDLTKERAQLEADAKKQEKK